ncbi:hypothetical protein BDW68DRAFT_103519 [Aspergillus falconensis]
MANQSWFGGHAQQSNRGNRPPRPPMDHGWFLQIHPRLSSVPPLIMPGAQHRENYLSRTPF